MGNDDGLDVIVPVIVGLGIDFRMALLVGSHERDLGQNHEIHSGYGSTLSYASGGHRIPKRAERPAVKKDLDRSSIDT